MPLDEARRFCPGFFRGGGSLFCCLCRPSSGSLPRLLAVLPFLPKPFPGTLLQLRVLLALVCVLLLFMMQSCSSSLVMLGNSGAGAVGATTYPSKDEDILGAEAA